MIIALALMACSKVEKAHQDCAALPVKTMVIAPQSHEATSRYVGTVVPAHEIPLSLQSTGRVVAIYVKNGDRVHKGQQILSIDNTQALHALQGAEATLKHAQDGYDRVSKVHEQGVVSDQKMVEVESQLAQAQSIYSAAKKRLEECTVVAPADGVISGLNLEIGQTVLPDARVCSLLDIAGFSIRFVVPENEIGAIRIGDRGEMECAAVNATFQMVVTEKSLKANPLAHTYEVTARIKGDTKNLMSEMVGVAILPVAATAQQTSIVIPARCILLKPQGPTVWVVEQGSAVRRDIVVGGYQADGVRVESGLMSGDTLIIDGYQKLYNNCKVTYEDK